MMSMTKAVTSVVLARATGMEKRFPPKTDAVRHPDLTVGWRGQSGGAGQGLGGLGDRKVVGGQMRRGAVAAPAQQAPIEEVERVAHGTALVMAGLWRNGRLRQSLPRAAAGLSGSSV